MSHFTTFFYKWFDPNRLCRDMWVEVCYVIVCIRLDHKMLKYSMAALTTTKASVSTNYA